MDQILPRAAQLKSPQWWVLVGALAAATFLAALGSYAIALTNLMISPMLLTPGIGTAVLVRWGRSLWPGFVVGDLAGQLLIREHAWTLILLSTAIHLMIVLLGTTWVRRSKTGVGNLADVLRYAGITTVLSVAAAAFSLIAVLAHGGIPADDRQPIFLGWLILGYLGGYLVAGGLAMAWVVNRADVRADLHDAGALTGTALVTVCAVLGFGWGVGVLVPIALLAALALAARRGPRWSTLAMAIITAAALSGAARGLAPFGGIEDGEQAANVMLAVTLFTLAALMLAGFRESAEGVARPASTVAMLFGVFMIIAGISGIATNQLAINHDTPFVNSGMLSLGAALGLLMLRLARTPPRATTRTGFTLAAIAGAIYVANLALFLQSVPLIGGAASTALSMTAPLAVVVLAIFVERARPSGGVVLAVGLIVAGAIFYASGITWNTTGVVLALGSAWVFAASLIFMTRALARSNVTDVALVGAFAAAAVALPVGLIVEGPDAFVFTSSEIGALALGALGAQLVPQLSRSWALAQIGPSPVGAIGVLAPVVTISLSMWLLSNPIDAGEIGGLVLIVGGALTATLAGTRGKNGTAGAHAEVLEAEPAPT
jgi:drug/metabolite transporter (DMT)-like permease